MTLRFSKMHGIGNDFVVVDCRTQPLALDSAQIARLGDRRFGVGFDQLLTIEPGDSDCAFRYGIYNADGSPALQCGNGVRCVAAWLQRAGALGKGVVRLQSPSGPVSVELLDNGHVRVDMGVPRFAPEEIPLRMPASDIYWLQINDLDVEFGAVSMGNPHAVIEIADVVSAPLETLGRALSQDSTFPQGCNVGFAQILDRAHLRLRVWERGAGATLACGSGACAAVAVLRQRGKLDAEVAVQLPGGVLDIHWDGADTPVWMSGPAEFVFEGEGGFMNEMNIKDGLGAMEVASYLRRHPEFLTEFPDIALALQMPREQGASTSLASYQLEVLRDKNRDLNRRLHELIEIAHENEQLMVRVHSLTVALMRERTLGDSVRRVVAGLTEDFHTDLVRLVLFRDAIADLPAADWLILAPGGASTLPAFAEFLKRNEPLCGRLQEDKLDALFGAHVHEVHSTVLMPIDGIGMLAIGSHDGARFHPGMGTVFLKLIAEAIAAAVARFPQT